MSIIYVKATMFQSYWDIFLYSWVGSVPNRLNYFAQNLFEVKSIETTAATRPTWSWVWYYVLINPDLCLLRYFYSFCLVMLWRWVNNKHKVIEQHYIFLYFNSTSCLCFSMFYKLLFFSLSLKPDYIEFAFIFTLVYLSSHLSHQNLFLLQFSL